MCALCGMEREDTFHALCRCPLARSLWMAMESVWSMPKLESISNTGPEWIIHLPDNCNVDQRLPVIMTLWRNWYVRNEVYHEKPAPPVEASRRFLCGYIDTLLHIQQHPTADIAKSKEVVSYNRHISHARTHAAPATCTRPPEC